jgi:gliding motility-associated-like protein
MNTTMFQTPGDTLYAMVAADGCTSNLVMIILEVSAASAPEPTCEFASIDSLSISWLGTAGAYELSYTINGKPSGGPMMTSGATFAVGSLGQGDTLEFTITALFGNPCGSLSTMITCITDVCPPQTVSLPGLASVYCRNEPFVVVTPDPPGGVLAGEGLSGDTLNPNQVNGGSTIISYSWSDLATGCVYDITAAVQIADPVGTPSITCVSDDINSIAFDWNGIATAFGYTFSINQGSMSSPLSTSDVTLLVDHLNEGDEVTLMLWSIGMPPCGNSDTISLTCVTKQCPQATVAIQDPGNLCSGDDAIQLDAMIIGFPGSPEVNWSGNGIIDPSGVFDPMVAGPGSAMILAEFNDGECKYLDSIEIRVIQQPVAAFGVSGTLCLDSALHVNFTGMAFGTAQFDWDFDGGTLVSGSLPTDFSVMWTEPGDHAISLEVAWQGCVSGLFKVPVQIDLPLSAPEVFCIEEDFYSVVVGWGPVSGATSYTVISSIGVGSITGNTYIVRSLPDNSPVNVTVTANTSSACGPTSASIECMTLDYIPPVTFVPNIFSPNNDGINDVFYIQSNAQVTEVKSFRIYDRWGAVVFEDLNFLTNDPQHGWDGSYGGRELDPAVFVYAIVVETIDDRQLILKGDVALIR